MNTRELIHYINTIADNIPIVKSFNDTDPYTYWNSQEVKYGSVIFAVKGYNQLSGVTRYNCVIYYGDRVLKDESNVNNIYTDAQTTINTIITNVELADGTVTVVSGSPAITFFRQRFLDELAGGYCNFTIEADDAVGACGYGHGEIISPGGSSIEVEVLMEKIRRLEAEVSQLEAEIGIKDETIAELRADIVELEKENEELRKGLQPLLDRIAELEGQVTALNAEISRLEGIIDNKDATIAALNDEISRLEGVVSSLTDQIVEKNAEISRLEGVIEQKDDTIANLNDQITSLNEQITLLQQSVADKEATIISLNNQITSLNNQITNLQNQIAVLNTKTVNYMFGQVQSSSHVFYYDGDDGGDYSAIIAELPQGWTAVAIHSFTINATPANANIQINYN